MKIRVRVHAGAKVTKCETRGDELHVWVKAQPLEGKANLATIEALAALHGVPKQAVRLTSGQTSKTKIFEIAGVSPKVPRP